MICTCIFNNVTLHDIIKEKARSLENRHVFSDKIVLPWQKHLSRSLKNRSTYMNIRFNHGFSVFNVGCGPRSILMPDAKRSGGH